MSNLVTIRSFSNSMDYEMAKSFLESCGINCIGQDKIINRVYIANATGGAKLQVRNEDAEESVRLLLEAGYLKESDFEPSPAIKWIGNILSKLRNKKQLK